MSEVLTSAMGSRQPVQFKSRSVQPACKNQSRLDAVMMSVKSRAHFSCATMSALCLTVLPFRLRIAKLAKRALPAYSHALFDILSADSVSFFSFAESNDETISMISTLSSLRKLPAGADFTVASERWRCLIVSEGEIVNASSSSMICMVSEVLAKAGFSIFYVSGSTTDYGTDREA
jgi:hypothetical protein